GNPATNVIPAEARAGFNIRFNDLHTGEKLIAWLRRSFDSIGGDYDLNARVSGEAFLTPPGALSELVSAAVEDVLGRAPELSTSGGTSDARFIKNACPVCEFGMVGLTMHKADERCSLDDLERLAAIYARMLERYFETAR
ncbi:MAG: M20/M25/M40 family metallo-hydrolase, partial [Rhodobacteraceae bacterium]|nr:M20/M25/M40 family metallo-hydrolase [Paracoccaceae bacterium]